MHDVCQACERATPTVVDTCDDEKEPYYLCEPCHHRLHASSLRPIEWYNLAKRHGPDKFSLHDDFYDEDGNASQPEEAVVCADSFPAPALVNVSGQLDSLLDFSITRRWITPELIEVWKAHRPDEVGEVLSCRFDTTTNSCIRSVVLELMAATWGKRGADLVRRAWEEYPDSVELPSLAKASAHCLPYREAFDRVSAAVQDLKGKRKAALMFTLAHFHSRDVLDWIEANYSEPYTESWGDLAAASGLDWPRVVRWIDSGRPLSLIAIDALYAMIRPRTLWLREYGPRLHDAPDLATARRTLMQYRERDPVPRVQRRVDVVLDNWGALLSESKQEHATIDTTSKTISAGEFRKQLIAVIRRGGGQGLPRKRRDRHILFRAAVQSLGNRSYSETALNEALKGWLVDVGIDDRLDHVSLRRYLVDAGYLQRDPGGSEYQVVASGREEVLFDEDVCEIDVVELIQSAHEQTARRKDRWSGAVE